MRILFLTDSIQHGASGVGDYTLHLAAQLNRMSVDALIEPIGTPGSPLRASLCERVHQHQADWVSVQFVPYAYAHRGLVSHYSLPWSQLTGTQGTHVMFHELWIGAHRGASWRERGVGFLQRRGIQSMIKHLNPYTVHCSNPLYSSMLKRAGIQNSLLPLFGSIPIQPRGGDPYVDVVTPLGSRSDRSGWVVTALFGTIHQSANLLSAVQWLNNMAHSQGKRLLVVSLGHSPSAASTFERFAAHFTPQRHPTFIVKGPLPADHLSRWISNADCALCTTPFNIIDKSSSAAAFVDHGVPVIVPDRGGDVRGLDYDPVDRSPAIWLFSDPRLGFGNRLPKLRDPEPSLPRVAAQFLDELSK